MIGIEAENVGHAKRSDTAKTASGRVV
jgi:hypothetical protein